MVGATSAGKARVVTSVVEKLRHKLQKNKIKKGQEEFSSGRLLCRGYKKRTSQIMANRKGLVLPPKSPTSH